MAHFHRTATAAQLTDDDDEGIALAPEHPLDVGDLFAPGEGAVVAIEVDPDFDPSRLPDAAIVAHVEQQHHAYVRRAVPYVVPLLARVAGGSGTRNPKLGPLCEVGEELVEALETHVDADGWRYLRRDGGREGLREELERVVCYQAKLALLLARVRALADGFVAPEWADRTYRTLLEELEALEENVLQGLCLEKSVLIPRLTRRCAAC